MRLKIAAFALATGLLMPPNVCAQDQGTQPSTAPPAASLAPNRLPTRIRVGENVQAASLLHQVVPEYPPEAKAAHITGTVVLHAIVGRDGAVQNLEFVSGPPELQKAAMDAVAQWRYKPTLLNGQPIEVDTKISIVFALAGDAPAVTVQEKSPSTAKNPIDPQLRADIVHFLDVAHVKDKEVAAGRTVFDSMRPMLLNSLPPTPSREKIVDTYIDKLMAIFQTDEFTNRLVETYAKYFSDDDIKGLTQFFQTPAGKHYSDIMPQLFGDLNQLGQKMAMENLGGIFRDLCGEYPELQGAAGFCPTENKENKSLLIEPKQSPAANASGSASGR